MNGGNSSGCEGYRLVLRHSAGASFDLVEGHVALIEHTADSGRVLSNSSA
jgi:hypothetical protein